jgi:hypothetical protein
VTGKEGVVSINTTFEDIKQRIALFLAGAYMMINFVLYEILVYVSMVDSHLKKGKL